MFGHLLAPLDGSTLAECTLPHVIAVGRAFGSQVTLLRVVDQTQTDERAQPIDPLSWHLQKTETTAYLDAVAARLAPTGVPLQTVVLEGGAAERIIEFAQSQGVEIVVLSSHGRSGLSGWNISSIAQKILLRTSGSTLIVRAYQPWFEQPEGLRYQRLLVPLDGSFRAEIVLPAVTLLAQHFGAHVLVTHIVNRPETARRTPPSEEDTALMQRVLERSREEAQHYLEQLRTRLPFPIDTRVSEEDSVSPALQDIAEEDQTDLVILSAHGHSGKTKWPYGSVVTSFVAYGTAPLLIVQDAPTETTQGAVTSTQQTAPRLPTSRLNDQQPDTQPSHIPAA